MKVLLLLVVFVPFIQSVQASYDCEIFHKQSSTDLHLSIDEEKEVEIGDWKVFAGIKRVNNLIEVSLERSVDVMDMPYQKVARRSYPLKTKKLPIVLTHSFAGKVDVFSMICEPRD